MKFATQPLTQPDLSLRHLQAELARIDLLIQREVRRWQLAGQDPADVFRGLHVTSGEVDLLLRRPFGTSWGQIVALEPPERQAFVAALDTASHQAQELAARARKQGQIPRLEHLATTFGLDRFDLDTLLICLAPALDLRYERLYGFLQDDVTRKAPRVNLVLDMLCEPGPKRLLMLPRFAADAPLFKYHFVERAPGNGPDPSSLLNQVLCVDNALVTWLLGEYQPHQDLGPLATLRWSQEDELALSLPAEITASLGRVLAFGQPIVVFYGQDQAGQQAAARLLASQAKRPLLTVDLKAAVYAGLKPLRALRLALRDARLTGAVLCLDGLDACLPVFTRGAAEGPGPSPEGVPPSTIEGSSPPAEFLAELCAHPDLVIVAGRTAWQAAGTDRERTLFWLEFPIPDYQQRQALWGHYLGQTLAGAGANGSSPEVSESLASLASQFALTTGQIRDAVASARDIAAQRDGALRSVDLFAAARAHSNPHLGTLARKIEPRYEWSDIVLPEDQLALLHEIVDTVRGRSLVLEEWGVGQKLASSSGVTILFSGPPGTGKTMGAEVMAAELSLDLYKIDLSTVVSKYIGETEKNLEKIFNEAQSSNAILFFDEADAIFGKRSEVKDAHDRYANIEISYLLQRMEAYDGVTILATNLRANLDEAFTRRLQFAVDFPFPDRNYRLRIWETLFPPGVPRDPDLDFELLAHRFKLAGGNIRNILVGAAYLAAADGGRLTMKHLLHGTRRELQKMGRLVNERDLATD